MQKTCRFT